MSTNLYAIYKQVYVRHRASADKSVSTQILSASMHDAANLIIEKYTLKSVKVFEKEENNYLKCSDVDAKHPYAKDFYLAIRSKNFYVEKPSINTSGLGKIVTDGIVYFLKSSGKPKQIKIGFTNQDIRLRMNQIKNLHKLPDIGAHFYITTNKATELERALHGSLKLLRVSGRVKDDSKEWFYLDRDRAVNALFRIAQRCDASVKVEWASAYYKKQLVTKFSCD